MLQNIKTYVYDKDSAKIHIFQNQRIETAYPGTGDLFAAVVCGAMVKGMEAKAAVDRAVYFLQEAIGAASRDNIPPVHGVHFEKYLSRLIE